MSYFFDNSDSRLLARISDNIIHKNNNNNIKNNEKYKTLSIFNGTNYEITTNLLDENLNVLQVKLFIIYPLVAEKIKINTDVKYINIRNKKFNINVKLADINPNGKLFIEDFNDSLFEDMEPLISNKFWIRQNKKKSYIIIVKTNSADIQYDNGIYIPMWILFIIFFVLLIIIISILLYILIKCQKYITT